MNCIIRYAVLFTALSAISVSAQSPTSTQSPAATTTTPAAYVYVQTSHGVNAYRAAMNGALTLIPGSPFYTKGLMIGSNRSYFITVGTDYIHTYHVAANGAIKAQATPPVNTWNNGGSGCGKGIGTNGAVLDPTGKYLYVRFQGAPYDGGTCAAYQAYRLNSDGSLTFMGAALQTFLSSSTRVSLPSFLGNEKFAYTTVFDGKNSQNEGYGRESWGTLDYLSFSETDPRLANGSYTEGGVDASPTGNYTVVTLYPNDSTPPQLGSYVVGSQGNLTTTNTSAGMPYARYANISGTSFSPAGNLFAVWNANGAGGSGVGIQLFHFNGAAPLTRFTTVLNGTPVNQVGWDSAGHLYAVSTSAAKLYVFTVTSTGVTPAPGSPIALPNPTTLKVVSM